MYFFRVCISSAAQAPEVMYLKTRSPLTNTFGSNASSDIFGYRLGYLTVEVFIVINIFLLRYQVLLDGLK